MVFVKYSIFTGKVIPTDMLSKIEEPKQVEKLSALKKAPRFLCRTLVVFFNW